MTDTLKAKVDQLGRLRDRIRILQEKEKQLAKELEIELEDRVVANEYKATKIRTQHKSVSWKKIAEKLKPSRQLIQAHTTVRDVVYIRITPLSPAEKGEL